MSRRWLPRSRLRRTAICDTVIEGEAPMPEHRIEHQPWPARVVILFVIGIVLAITFDALLPMESEWSQEPFRLAVAISVAVGGLTFAYTLQRLRWWWSILFALGCALVAGGILYWNGGPEQWPVASLLLAIAVAAPLFQVVRDEGRWSLQPHAIHAYVWSNLVLWGVSWLFVLVSFLLANLLGELFGLTGLDFLKDLLRDDWFNAAIVGGALGLAIGVLRDRDQLLEVIQRVATVVLSMLTPVIAVGLGFFLLSLPFTGLGPLWETNQTTPILLACALIAFFFVNGTIGSAPEDEPRNPILRYGAIVLAIVIAPLALIALVSTSLRIGQHGFTPDRLWAATCVLAAVIYGLAYWAALALGRAAWSERLRTFNVWLGAGLCLFGILLATPIVNFGTISTRDQLARLNSGKVAPDEFDWRALAFDFGPSGRRALERLKQAGVSEVVRKAATEALAYKSRWDAPEPLERAERRAAFANLRVLPKAVPLPPALAVVVEENGHCSGKRPCTIYYEEGSDRAVLITQPTCAGEGVATSSSGTRECSSVGIPLFGKGEHWFGGSELLVGKALDQATLARIQEGWRSGKVEVRAVQRRQVFIGGEPVGQTFD